MNPTLILLRHGQSTWNKENRFTGWWDVPLSDQGEREARQAGRSLRNLEVPVAVAHTSVLTRAIHTCELALTEAGRNRIRLKRHWRLNERHYGDLTGRDKAETAAIYGVEQVQRWRRSYATAPPAITDDNPFNPADDPRFDDIAPQVFPVGEALKDVLERLLPYWFDCLTPDLRRLGCVLVSAHGNSLRALVKHLDEIADNEISGVEIPTGVPILYEIGADMMPSRRMAINERFLSTDS